MTVEAEFWTERPQHEPRSLAAIFTAAVAVVWLLVVAAAAACCWYTLVYVIATADVGIVDRLLCLCILVAPATGGFSYVAARMAQRRDLSVSSRAAWLCLPVVVLGLWSLVCLFGAVVGALA